MTKNADTITWFQVNNIVPLITSLIIITIAFQMLMTRVAILESKIDLVLEQQKEANKEFSTLRENQNNLSLKVTALEAVNALRK